MELFEASSLIETKAFGGADRVSCLRGVGAEIQSHISGSSPYASVVSGSTLKKVNPQELAALKAYLKET